VSSSSSTLSNKKLNSPERLRLAEKEKEKERRKDQISIKPQPKEAKHSNSNKKNREVCPDLDIAYNQKYETAATSSELKTTNASSSFSGVVDNDDIHTATSSINNSFLGINHKSSDSMGSLDSTSSSTDIDELSGFFKASIDEIEQFLHSHSTNNTDLQEDYQQGSSSGRMRYAMNF